jgi:hypothetical protein
LRLARQTELDAALTLKLDRAKAHLERLRESIDEWREGDRYRFITHEEEERRGVWKLNWDIIQTEPFPPEWVLWAGEFLYQTHSSLDHLAWELADTKAAPNRPDNVTFPIFASRSRFWRQDSKGGWRQSSGAWAIQRLPGPFRVPLLEVQPYKCGDRAPDHPLWRLHELSNEDKHQSLHVASSAVKRQRFQGLHLQDLKRDGAGINNHDPFDNGKRGNNAVWLRLRATGPKPEIKGQAELLIEPVFGKGSPACVFREPFYDTLRAIYNYVVQEVVERRYNPLFP